MDTNTFIIVGILALMVVWLFGLIRKIGGCLIHLLLLAAGALLVYAFYTGRIAIPL